MTMVNVPPKTEDAYLWVALASGLVFFFIPLAIHRMVKYEIDFKSLRPELYDVVQNLYLFFGWCGFISLLRSFSRYMYGGTSMDLGLALNASRLVAGLWLIYLAGRVLAKQGRLIKWRKQQSLQAAFHFPSGPKDY